MRDAGAEAMERDDLLAEYFRLTRVVLPGRAQREHWVVRYDHCFQRIILDHLFGDAWRNHLSSKQPAYRQLDEAQLSVAVNLAQRIEREGDALLRKLNEQSLVWRGKVH